MKAIVVLICICVIAAVFSVSVHKTQATPTGPCDTWGKIKSCYGDNPAPCCSWKKQE